MPFLSFSSSSSSLLFFSFVFLYLLSHSLSLSPFGQPQEWPSMTSLFCRLLIIAQLTSYYRGWHAPLIVHHHANTFLSLSLSPPFVSSPFRLALFCSLSPLYPWPNTRVCAPSCTMWHDLAHDYSFSRGLHMSVADRAFPPARRRPIASNGPINTVSAGRQNTDSPRFYGFFNGEGREGGGG